MSLICETIASEDESRADDEELDFEEDVKDDKDEGELDDDEDLEEGEVKDDEPHETREPQQQQRQNSVCRFYGRGQCTWGNNCRFVHPSGGQNVQKRIPPQNRRRAEQQWEPQNESAWERGLKQAKAMIVRASRRKEEEEDFEDKRFNISTTDPNRAQEDSPDDRYDEEYERRRRLAFESAPWNNDEAPGARQRQAETYRDPWRRSKSPQNATTKTRRPPNEGSGSKRSHSMSSISASGSESSEFSGSEGSESFSESSLSGRSIGGKRQNRKQLTERPKDKNYDSWSESLSSSESVSSYYSDEESNEEKREENHKKRKEPKREHEANKRQKSEKKPIRMTFSQQLKTQKQKELNGSQQSPKESPPRELSSPRLAATFSRREELLQQLKAVEDAIARKRSKIN